MRISLTCGPLQRILSNWLTLFMKHHFYSEFFFLTLLPLHWVSVKGYDINAHFHCQYVNGKRLTNIQKKHIWYKNYLWPQYCTTGSNVACKMKQPTLKRHQYLREQLTGTNGPLWYEVKCAFLWLCNSYLSAFVNCISQSKMNQPISKSKAATISWRGTDMTGARHWPSMTWGQMCSSLLQPPPHSTLISNLGFGQENGKPICNSYCQNYLVLQLTGTIDPVWCEVKCVLHQCNLPFTIYA